MQLDPRTPVLVGGGQWNNRVDEGAPTVEPVDLIAGAARRAAADSGAADPGKVLAAVASVRVVGMLSWRYLDPGRLVAERIGAADVRQTMYTSMGGNTPQALVNATCRDIAAGDLDLAVIGGAEAWRSRSKVKAAGGDLGWTKQPDGTEPDAVFGNLDPLDMVHPLELQRGVVAPVQVYPMFESALRAQAGATAEAWRARLGRLWSRFSEVAAANPDAWLRQAWTPEEVVAVSPDNRMIGAPYPKRLNSNNAVEQGAAVLVCSVEAADRLGIPSERWVFPWAGTDGYDAGHASTRRDFHSSPAIGVAGGRAMALAGVGPDDLAHVDLYSCFPSAVQLGAQELGLGVDRDLTVTGGLSFAGGPWNNYVTHSIATMARVLREDPGAVGLVTANGGLVQKHAFGVYATTPPAAGFRSEKPQAEIDAAAGTPVVAADPAWSGAGVVEAYTVMHDREGGAEKGLAAVATADGTRPWATTTDADTMASMLVDQWVGRAVEVTPDATFGAG
jgi:acetyl-CoA C-acetyltransferase